MKKKPKNFYEYTHPGRRPNNEDKVLSKPNNKYKEEQVIVAAADGMGGYQRGDMASKLMIAHLEKLNQKELPSHPTQISHRINQ
jgi:serine/threonine protein phosphatase PrpC